MKRLVLSLLTVAGLGFAASAQTNNIKIGVKAGVTFPTFGVSGTENKGYEQKISTSFYVGGTVDIAVSDIFSVQPGLSLIGKGGKTDFSYFNAEIGNSYTVTANSKISTMYIELPVNAVFNFDLGSGKIFIGAGPYYAVAISGKNKSTASLSGGGSTMTESVNEDIKFGKDGTMKRGDFGVNFLAGYQLSNGFNIHAGYGLGLSNLDYADKNASKVTNRVLSVGVGFAF
ncbi:porin family protein [Pedobacter miscanthi]|uniref:PorT family protein n=1 Tax=Pedobacter miscanthi TaxID=2259170 RepID=A0A366L4K3_9SPHI|nr:porin family protein [Pedobacter miscanthi]RBQ08756.1 PorT family protein [Pedobacter miscanthi]